MKTLSIVFLSLFTLANLGAQNTWEGALKSQIAKADQARSLDDLTAPLATMERIALTEKGEWLTNYYAAYYHGYKFWWSMGSESSCKDCLSKMDDYLKVAEAADNNVEVMTLRAYYNQAMLNADPSQTMILGPKTTGILMKAVGMDSENPRANLLLGQNILFTPEQYGGGAANAKPYLDKANALFAAQKADGLNPSWGQRDLERLNGQMKK